MNAYEALDLHKQLWRSDSPRAVLFKDRELPVRIADTKAKDFKSVSIDGLTVVTQNMRKPSRNTDWVNEAPGNKMTWVLKGDQWLVKIRSWLDPETSRQHHEVITLRPDTVVLAQEELVQLAGAA